MIRLLESYGLKSSEAVILIVSIATFSITTIMSIVFNYLSNRQNRISREREWKFRVYYEFFNEMDSKIDIITREMAEYVVSAVNNLVNIANDPDSRMDDFSNQTAVFTNRLVEQIGVIEKSKDRISLFTGKKSNEALDRYVQSINIMWDSSMKWIGNRSYDDIFNSNMKALLEDFTEHMNRDISELMLMKKESYRAIRRELGLR